MFTKKNWTWKKKLILLFVISFVLPFGFANADHLGQSPDLDPDPPVLFNDPQPCRDLLLEIRNVNIRPGVPGSGAGEVPVYDNDVTRNLVILVEAMARSLAFTELQDTDVQSTAEYLRLLCRKEYEEDHTLQHAWANLIGEFVDETLNFIHQGYNGNPAFLTSQEVYYQLVNISTARVFMQDIVDSPNLGNDTKRTLVQAIAAGLFGNKFPTDDGLAPDNLPEDLSADFYGNGGFPSYNKLLFDEDASSETVINDALAELAQRMSQQNNFEREKLAWGRGFFSYEICDLGVYVRNIPGPGEPGFDPNEFPVNAEDRRNCRIATPGSLIQDQTSFVFGSALRQMEINDEYEEWIAPNTLAVLSDILSYRGINNFETRNSNPVMANVNQVPTPTQSASPDTVRAEVEINSLYPSNQPLRNYPGTDLPGVNIDGPLPFEFSEVYDDRLFNQGDVGSIGENFFFDVLDPDRFLDQIP